MGAISELKTATSSPHKIQLKAQGWPSPEEGRLPQPPAPSHPSTHSRCHCWDKKLNSAVTRPMVSIPSARERTRQNKTGLFSFIKWYRKAENPTERCEGSHVHVQSPSLKKWGTQKSHSEDSSTENQPGLPPGRGPWGPVQIWGCLRDRATPLTPNTGPLSAQTLLREHKAAAGQRPGCWAGGDTARGAGMSPRSRTCPAAQTEACSLGPGGAAAGQVGS